MGSYFNELGIINFIERNKLNSSSDQQQELTSELLILVSDHLEASLQQMFDNIVASIVKLKSDINYKIIYFSNKQDTNSYLADKLLVFGEFDDSKFKIKSNNILTTVSLEQLSKNKSLKMDLWLKLQDFIKN